jgi:hypothetical protein
MTSVSRSTLLLDGTWQAQLDPDDVGLAEGWLKPNAPFDRILPVPMAWQAADPALGKYAGVAWYRRSFVVPANWRGRDIAVRFGAVDYRATVWVNGREVGGHEGGYTPFELDATEHLRWGEQNWVTLRVYDPASVLELPHGKQGGRWYTPVSGPWQSVALVARPTERVEQLRCHPDGRRGTARVEIAARVGDGPRRVDVVVVDAAGDSTVARATALVSAETPAAWVELRIPEPRLWEPDSPYLYGVRATLSPLGGGAALDVLEDRFGLRTIESSGGRLLLNGRPLYLRGALDQAYWPDTLYTVPSDEEIEREIRLAKEMGLNLLRKHIKPEDPRYLDAADRLGMLIWAEPANPTLFTPTAREGLRRDLLEMIERDFNRPSVIIWSLYNEDWGLPSLWGDPEKQHWLAELHREVKATDPTRLVCDNSGWAHVVTDINDYHEYYLAPERIERLRQRLDFIAERSEDNFAQGHLPAGEPIVISEFGNWALPNPRDARERSGGGEPPWFGYDRSYTRAEGLPPPRLENPLTERIKTIAGFEERFRRLGLDAVFETTDALIEHVQRRAFRSLKAQIEEMRIRPAIQGYVVTELADIEWEANGWLDYWRQPKLFHGDLADVNAAVALIARPERTNIWGGDRVAVGVQVANTTDRTVRGRVRWQLTETELAGELPVTAGPHGVTPSTPIVFAAPDDRPRLARLELGLHDGDGIAARTYAELGFAPPAAGLVDGTPANGNLLDRVFRQRLERQGYRIPRGFDLDIPLAIATQLDETLLAYLEAGGRLLYLAGGSSEGADLVGLRFTGLSPAESWRMASGSAWARADRLAPAPVSRELGWEVADLFPVRVIEADCLRPDDEQLAGWFEGWLANAGSLALLRTVGAGRLLVTTLRFEDHYGLDPVATLLLNRLVSLLQEAGDPGPGVTAGQD